MKTVVAFLLVFWACLAHAQKKNPCNLKAIDDVHKAKIELKDFEHKDTTVVVRDRNGEVYSEDSYNVIFRCKNGTVILGNVDEHNVKQGRWSFEKKGSSGYEGHIEGQYKDDKMHGYWSHGPYSSLYKNGKFIKTTRIPF